MAGTRTDETGSAAAAGPAPEEPLAESAVAAARDLRAGIGRLRRRLREVAAGTEGGELTPSQTAVLTRLSREGAWTASGLAASERVRPQSMAATLAALDSAGLIERAPDPTDGRRQLITLTEQGLLRAAGDAAARPEWLNRAMHDHFTEAERQTVIEAMRLLDRLANL